MGGASAAKVTGDVDRHSRRSPTSSTVVRPWLALNSDQPDKGACM